MPSFAAQNIYAGVYVCATCATPLFEAAKSFDAHCGFPSFWQHIGNNVKQVLLHTYGRERIQLRCSHCDRHLGHLFGNGHTPTGIRYCINHEAIVLKDKPILPS